ncbi:MAG: PAS domain S-box protein [Vulcanimicrobiota bacterium]
MVKKMDEFFDNILKILYVDDREENFWIFKTKLLKHSSSFKIAWRKTPVEVFETLETDVFDCVITDFNLGGNFDGIDLIRELKQICPETPVIMITSETDPYLEARALRAGVDDFFHRKAGISSFKRIIHTIINHIKKNLADKQRRYYQSLFRHAIDSNPVATFIVDENKNILCWNRACIFLTRKNLDEMSEHYENLDTFRPIGDAPDIKGLIDQTLEGRKDVAGFAQGYYLLPGAVKKYLLINFAPLKNNKGKLEALLVTIEDLTQIVQTKEKLAQKNQQLIKLINHSPLPIYIHQDNTFKLFNKRLSEVTGYSEEELASIHIWKLVHPDYRQKLQKNASDRLKNQEVPLKYDFVAVKKDGTPFKVRGYFTLVIYENQPAVLGQIVEETD